MFRGELPEGPADFLTAFLASNDAPCPGCGYSLRNLKGRLCPECGAALDRRVGLVDPRLKLWVAGLVGLAAGAGFNALLLIYLFLVALRERARMNTVFDEFLIINGAGLAVEGAALLTWIALGSRFRRASIAVRGTLVAAAWALSFLNVWVFAVYIR